MQKPKKEVQRRRYVRVKDILRVRYRLLQPSEVESWRNMISVPKGSRGSMEQMLHGSMHRLNELQEDLGVPAILIELLIGIDKKLDTLLNAVQQPSLVTNEYEETLEVDLSGSGMRFLTTMHYQRGDLLGITMTLPTFPPRDVLAIGKVIRSIPYQDNGDGSPGFSTSLNFDDINEDARDQLVRYTFQRQREVVRQDHAD